MVSAMMLKIGANSVKSAPGGSPRSSQKEHPLSVAAQVTHLRGLRWTSWVPYQLQNLVRSTSWLLETASRNGPSCSHSRMKEGSKTVAEKLVDEVISRFGAPERINTDQGRNFEAHLFKEMYNLCNIEKTRTTLYHPQSDGMVEGMNRTIQDMLAKYVAEHQRDWDVHLPIVMMVYRSNVHSSTQYTPHYLLFGHEERLPLDVMYGREPHQRPEAASEYVRNPRSTLEEAHERLLRSPRRRRRDKVWRSCVLSCSCSQVWTEEEVAFTMVRSTCASKENQRCNLPDRRSGQP